jgi:hypothetical protein
VAASSQVSDCARVQQRRLRPLPVAPFVFVALAWTTFAWAGPALAGTDGARGMLLAWADATRGGIYGRDMGSDGSLGWGATGPLLDRVSEYSFSAAPDGAAAAVCSSGDHKRSCGMHPPGYTTGAPNEYARKVDASGAGLAIHPGRRSNPG